MVLGLGLGIASLRLAGETGQCAEGEDAQLLRLHMKSNYSHGISCSGC